jgi:signal transduction histidine kinase/CheY-like chemotaxis protein
MARPTLIEPRTRADVQSGLASRQGKGTLKGTDPTFFAVRPQRRRPGAQPEVAVPDRHIQPGDAPGALHAAKPERDAWFLALFQDHPDALLIVDEEGRVRDANEAVHTLTGCELAALHGRPWASLLFQDPGTLPEPGKNRRARLVTATPSQLPVDVTARRVEHAHESAWLVTLRPARAPQQVSLLDMARRGDPWLVAILDLIPAAVFIGDATGIALSNTNGLELLGCDSIDELRAHIDDLSQRWPLRHPDTGDRLAIQDVVFARALRGETCALDVRLLHRGTGRELVLHSTATPILEAGKVVGALAVHTDITARLEAESQRRKAQKMEALGRLAGGVAHEFNNIMMGILGFVHLLLQDLQTDDPRRGDLEAIAGLSQRAAGLTSQLLAFARRQVLRPEVLETNAVLEDLRRLARSLVRADIDLEVGHATDPLPIRVDRAQLEQVLTTLVLHARDAMPSGGRLTIAAARVHLDLPPPATMEGATFHPGPYVRIVVNDTGPGLSREMRARLFEPFQSAGEGDRGGLGLASVLGFVHQSGGFVAVESAPGRGTPFALFLPLHAEPAETIESPANATGHFTGHEVILVAEDEAAVREVVARSLRMRGYKVVEARNGGEALHILQQGEPHVDLLVTDLEMPVLGGRELARAARSLRSDLPIVFMSAHSDNDEMLRDLIERRYPYLQKPFRPDALAKVVRDQLLARPAAPLRPDAH